MEFGELLKAFLLDLQSLFRYRVTNTDLTLPQILLLSSISSEGTDMSSLSKQMGVDNSTMTRLIGILIRNGWVEKFKGENDKRVVYVKITVKGEIIRQEIDNKINDFGLEIINTINPEDRNDIRETLTTLHWILSKKLLRTKKKNRSIITKISDMVEEAGGIDYAKKKLDEFSDIAMNAIDPYPESVFKRSLIDLVAFNASRVK